ncbi:hypothetical protein [Streptomyces sp. NPDC005548]|uniref:hypothetical protein n=1 Tax=Streptomyces sp. NPDC005548 TaxID=3364724 RepID=UPI00367A6FDD
MAITDKTPATETVADIRIVPARSIRWRARLERLVYGATALGITIAPQNEDLWPVHLGAAGIAIGAFSWLWGKWDNAAEGIGFLQASQRAVPFLSAAGLYLANMRHGADLWEYGLPAAWTILMAATTPITHSLNLHAAAQLPPAQQTLAPALTAATPAPPTTYPAYRAHQWEQARPTGSTRLVDPVQYETNRPDFWGIVIAEAGEAVPDMNPTALAGVFDLPVGTVTLQAINGSGPGRKILMARPTLDAQAQADRDPMHRLWDEKIAHPHGAAPGMLLTDYRIDDNRIALRTTAPGNQIINLNHKLLARAFDMADASLLMVETDGLGDGLISIYKTHPLMNVREATVEDLTMAEDGTIALGLRPDGRPSRMPLYDPQMGAVTDLFVGAPGAGKSVTLLTVLAAERINGIVSIVADAQDGMSLPEADGRVYHFGKGIAATAATLAASNDLGKYREKISAANGWGSFEPGQPWRIANDTLDELNRILSEDATVPRPFRKWVTGLVGDNQSTGRKLGKGIRFAAQSIHLADLGDKDRIRANAKNGTTWLGRTNSSTTQHMATDGVLPPGVYPEPIPRHFKVGSGNDIDAAFHGKEAAKGPITAGMANIIQSGGLFLGRTWFARKENKTYPGLIALMESAPIPRLTPEEDRVFQQSYAYWLAHAELLLSGDDENSIDHASAEADQYLADDEPEPSTATVKDHILDVLSDGPLPLKDVRKRLPDFAAGTVNNAMTELKNDLLVEAVGRGIYQRTN